MFTPEISIVIPCLNEAESLPYCISKAFSFFSKHKIEGEVIVVDNGSTDNSANIAEQMKAIVIHEYEKGYGNALLAGIKNAKGKYIIMGDADDSYDFSDLIDFTELLRNGNDMVIGNRFKGGIKKGAMPFLHRYIGNPVLSSVGRLFFKTTIHDFHCGLRGFSKESILKLDLRTTGMEFSSEMIAKATMYELKVTETPVILYPDKRKRESHLRTWRDGWRHLRFLLLFSPKWLFLLPGFFLLLLGLIGSVLLSVGPIQIGNKKLDVHTLVYTSGFVLIGFQFISFYFFTRLYAATNNLMPNQAKFLDNFHRYFHLEKGILSGIILFGVGIFFMIKSFLYWENVHFGDLDPVVVLRWVIPSLVMIVLGLQIIISCFYLSFLTIKSRDRKI
jgi:glycosyltransferase involved in cell wall biosynthesis